MDGDVHQESEAAIIRAFVFACTALKNAVPELFLGQADEQLPCIYVTAHGEGEGRVESTAFALQFLCRDVGTVGNSMARLLDADAVCSIADALVHERLARAHPALDAGAFLARVRTEVLSSIEGRGTEYRERIFECWPLSSSAQSRARALLSWLALQPLFPPRLGSRHSDLAYALLDGIRNERNSISDEIVQALPIASFAPILRESKRLEYMRRRFKELAGTGCERARELGSYSSYVAEIYRAGRRIHGPVVDDVPQP